MKQLAEMEVTLSEYSRKLQSGEEKVRMLESEKTAMKNISSVVEQERKRFKCVYNLLRCNAILFFIALVVDISNSTNVVKMLLRELKCYLSSINQIQILIYDRLFKKYMDETLFYLLLYFCLAGIVFLLHRIINFRTTMWRFYYVDKGVENRRIDRIIVVCISEYLLWILFLIAREAACNYIMLIWAIVICITTGMVYMKKVIIAYRRRAATVK